MVHRSEAERWMVVFWFKEGLSPNEIVNKTSFRFHFVKRWIERYKLTGTIQEERRSGHKPKRLESLDKVVEDLIRRKQRMSLRFVAQMLKRQKKAYISYETVRRAAHSRSLRPYRMQKASHLTEDHNTMCLKFAKANKKKRLKLYYLH